MHLGSDAARRDGLPPHQRRHLAGLRRRPEGSTPPYTSRRMRRHRRASAPGWTRRACSSGRRSAWPLYAHDLATTPLERSRWGEAPVLRAWGTDARSCRPVETERPASNRKPALPGRRSGNVGHAAGDPARLNRLAGGSTVITKPRRLFAAIAVAALSTAALAAPASADGETNTIAAEDRAEIEQNMDFLGIADATQQQLVDKLERGELLDSFDADAEPVDIIPVDQPGFESVIYVYEDGSRTKSDVEEGVDTAGGIAAQGIAGCTSKTFSGGISMSNCTVKVSTILYVGQFYANFTHVNGGNSYISKAYNWGCAGFGCNIEKTGIVKKEADLNGPAKAEMRVQVGGLGVTTTGYVQLFVEGSSAWTN
ncbi:hypothetical protein FM106_15515 [Brachybacterium faecium]|nr:hypothetical protein FM106_15515 [Brachybacterium faecium]